MVRSPIAVPFCWKAFKNVATLVHHTLFYGDIVKVVRNPFHRTLFVCRRPNVVQPHPSEAYPFSQKSNNGVKTPDLPARPGSHLPWLLHCSGPKKHRTIFVGKLSEIVWPPLTLPFFMGSAQKLYDPYMTVPFLVGNVWKVVRPPLTVPFLLRNTKGVRPFHHRICVGKLRFVYELV